MPRANFVFYRDTNMDVGVTAVVGQGFDLKAFGLRLEMLRRSRMVAEKLGLPRVSGADLARRIGIMKVRYHRYERGEIEPPIWILGSIGDLTGVSLDWLILGRMGQGQMPDQIADDVTVGDRLRAVREACSPIVEECAGYFGVDPARWRAYESGEAEIPLTFANEVVQRFPVTLDFLYRGDMSGLEPRVQYALLSARPELAPRLEANRQGLSPRRIGGDSPGIRGSSDQRASTGTPSASGAPRRGRSRKAAGDDSIARPETD